MARFGTLVQLQTYQIRRGWVPESFHGMIVALQLMTVTAFLPQTIRYHCGEIILCFLFSISQHR